MSFLVKKVLVNLFELLEFFSSKVLILTKKGVEFILFPLKKEILCLLLLFGFGKFSSLFVILCSLYLLVNSFLENFLVLNSLFSLFSSSLLLKDEFDGKL